ncbi:NADH dehydrogenase [ubiquinone] 1 alpha subcomplex subunit 13-like [Saccoglossus kowalevskii]
MSSVPYKQDMPPKGGYGPIAYKRHIPNRGVSGYMMFLGCAGAMTIGMIGLAYSNRLRSKLLAMKRLRDEEAEIMSDVPGWVVGESVYNSERWVWPSNEEFYNLLAKKDRFSKIHEYYLHV